MLSRLLPSSADRGSGRLVWRTVAGLLGNAARVTGRPALWFRTAVARDLLGDSEGAYRAIRNTLRGSVPAAEAKYLRLATGLSGELLRQQRWLEAIRLLEPALAAEEAAYDTLRELARAAEQIERWGGTFLGPAASPDTARFVRTGDGKDAGPARELHPDELRQLRESALRRAVALYPDRPGAKADLGATLAELGQLDEAIELHEQAIERAHDAKGRWAFLQLHRWQFALESLHTRQGTRRVEDPLFDTRVEVAGERGGSDSRPPTGMFDANVAFNGLQVEGFLATADEQRVDIQLDGETIRSLNVGGDGFFPSFAITFQRETVADLPSSAVLSVVTESGRTLEARGEGDRFDLTVPQGTGTLPGQLSEGATLDKKGKVSATEDELKERQEAYLELYADLRRFFAEEFGKPLMLMYGTLLGYHRDGDLIPGDDDFDAGYISDENDPVAVKGETMRVVATLVRAGYLVSFNRRGRLFRASRLDATLPEMHLDLRPLWFEDGNVWVHNHASFPATIDHFLPAATGTLRDVEVDVPRDTEHFLRGHYGSGWKVPDPGFVYHASDVDERVREHLADALITPREYRELLAELEAERDENPDMGRFVAVGAQDLYPLDRFIT